MLPPSLAMTSGEVAKYSRVCGTFKADALIPTPNPLRKGGGFKVAPHKVEGALLWFKPHSQRVGLKVAHSQSVEG